MKFYLDEDLSDEIARIARNLGVDVTSCHGLGREGLLDESQLAFAAADERCIVTVNGPDFIELTFRFIDEGRAHAGVLIVPESIPKERFADAARALAAFDEIYPGGMPPYFVGYLRV